ncbi:HD domain-containing protein [Ligilactobacillus sp. WC1T17]
MLAREKVLRDPVHDHIFISHQVILDLINTKEFQRLRRIKQLGTTSYTFHGAEHSRFSHSVGVYEITRRICDLFERNYQSQTPNDGLWDDSERLVALCAALLHDLGHGAYSHTFEHLFKTNHEKMTQQIITDTSTEVNQVLKKVDPAFPAQVASVINKTYPNPQVVQMISSKIDADRMDYLLRDSYFTGADYGTFDLTRILRVMRPCKDGIVFDKSGMHAVEDYIISRFQMYQQIYFHPVSRSMELVLAHLLKRAKDLYQQGKLENNFAKKYLEPFFNGNFSLEDYLSLDDGVLNTCFMAFRDAKDPILSDFARRFLDRHPLKSAKLTGQSKKMLPKLRQLVEKCGFDPAYYTGTNDSFDTPYKYDSTNIRLREKDGQIVELSHVSALVDVLKNRSLGDERFFFPKEMLDQNEEPEIFDIYYQEFAQHVKNDQIIQ